MYSGRQNRLPSALSRLACRTISSPVRFGNRLAKSSSDTVEYVFVDFVSTGLTRSLPAASENPRVNLHSNMAGASCDCNFPKWFTGFDMQNPDVLQGYNHAIFRCIHSNCPTTATQVFSSRNSPAQGLPKAS